MNTQHTQMEKNLFQRKFSHIKEKRIVTFESLVPRCWSPIVTKFLLILDQNFLAYKQQLYLFFFSLFLFFSLTFHSQPYWPPLPIQAPWNWFSSHLFPLLSHKRIDLLFALLRIDLLFTLLSQTIFFPLFLFDFYPIGLNISFLYLEPHLPLNGTTLKDLPWIVVIIDQWYLHLHLHYAAWWGAFWKLISSWCNSPPLHHLAFSWCLVFLTI